MAGTAFGRDPPEDVPAAGNIADALFVKPEYLEAHG